MITNEKGYSNLTFIEMGAVILVLIVGGSAWYASQTQNVGIGVCTLDVKLCPDGSYVGRTGPNCEFAACPEEKIDTSARKTYRNEKYRFEVEYPEDFSVTEGFDEYWRFNYTTFEPLKEKNILGKVSISYNGPDWPSDPQGLGSRRSLGKVVVDGIEGSHYVIPFGIGEVHDVFVYFQPEEIKFNINAQWGWVYDIPSPYNRVYDEDKRVIMDAFNQMLMSFKFTR